MKTLLMRCSVFLAVVMIPVAVLAQTTGQITGTVRDNTGSVVNGAKVTIRDTAKGVDRQTTSNTDGEYLVSGVGAGTYNISVTAAVFKTFSAKAVKLDVCQKSSVYVTLIVCATNTEVVVSD